MLSAVSIVLRVVADLVGWFALAFRSRRSLQAEVLFLRRQLALYVERGVKPRRIGAATRVSLTMLSRLFKWRSALVVVRPQTLIRWHRARLQAFLEVEVSRRTAAHPARATAADPTDGAGESAVGSGADRE